MRRLRAAARLRWLRAHQLLRFGLLLVGGLALVWAGIGLHLAEFRRHAENSALQDAGNLARGLEQNIIRSIEGADQMLRLLQALHARDPEGFDLFTCSQAWRPADGLAVQLAQIGPDGVMRASSMTRGTTPVDLSDREHFRVHRDSGEDHLFISRPVLGRVSGRWTIQLTRSLRDAAGRFGGVLVLSMDTDYLSRFYDSLRIAGGSIGLVGTDGVVRARAPVVDGAIGSTLPPAMLAHLQGQPEGSFWLASSLDGVERLFSFRAVAGYPLQVYAGLDREAVFADMALIQARSLATGAVVSLAHCLMVALLLRHARELERGRRVLRATLDRMTQGVVMADADGTVLVVNARARELLELPAALARPEAPLATVLARIGAPEPAAAPAGEAAPHLRRTARGATVETLRLALPDGGTLLTCTDVTAQRQTAEAREAALAAAEAANRAKSDFLANMSHEIRTPMNGILGMIALRGQCGADPQHRRICETVERSAGSLLRVLNDVLDFSKLEAGHIELEAVPCELGQLVEDVAALMGAAASAKGLALRVAIGPAPAVLVDGSRLRQILTNLLSNAVKFSDAGEITLSLEATPAAEGMVEVAITVRDQGIGIAPAALARLFTRFSQGDASSTRRFGGTGLGLAISRELARLMGGDIAVQSRPGEGSAFTLRLTLPVAASPPAAPVGEAPPDLRPLRRLDILVAEDDEINRAVAAGLLDPHGHRVEFAEDGDAALQAVRRRGQARPFDVILMDAMMPGMDGPTATARIRALGGAAGRTPIVALTANAMVGDRERYLAAGMDGYVSKPIDRRELYATLERLLDLHAFGPLPLACARTWPAPAAAPAAELAAEVDLLLAGLAGPAGSAPPQAADAPPTRASAPAGVPAGTALASPGTAGGPPDPASRDGGA